jgi:hypothetical protein
MAEGYTGDVLSDGGQDQGSDGGDGESRNRGESS